MNSKWLLVFVVLLMALVVLIPTTSAQDDTVNGFTVSYGGRIFDGTNTTFIYVVIGTGAGPDLSHFDVEIPQCDTALQVVAYNPADAVSFGTDPTTGVNGIKWDLPLGVNETRAYSITFAGEVDEGIIVVAVKGGPGFETTEIAGPACDTPALVVEKSVSADGGVTWDDADAAPGPEVEPGADVQFRVVVTNTGTEPLTTITLTDNVYDTTGCAIPDTLEPESAFECPLGPFPAAEGQHTNVVTVTALAGDEMLEATDSANYFGGELDDDDDTVIIVIEGPVQQININIITIYGINIELDPDDPLLTVIQIGDYIRVEGDYGQSGNTIIIIAVTIIIVDVDVVVDQGSGAVWRDPGDCGNPPPPWAPAHGWRRRCESGGGDNGSSGSRSGRGQGRGN